MPIKKYRQSILFGLMVALFVLIASQSWANPSSPEALAGHVSSQEEGPMEGVLVSAKKEGSNITITVASDEHGRYAFPRNRLVPGEYDLSIRAGGYEISPAKVQVMPGKTATANLKLRKVEDVSAQLTSAEWLSSAPGTFEQKNVLVNCTNCHTLERIFRSHHTVADWPAVPRRMEGYYEGSLPERPQLKPVPPDPKGGFFVSKFPPPEIEYVSSINLGSVSHWQYPLKTFPRPKGQATRMIVTQYDLPRKLAMPHDVVVGPDGMVWYSDHGQQILGRLDPKTGAVVEFKVPVLKPGIATGLHFLQLDSEGNIWLSMGQQGGVAKFDRRTEQFQTWVLPDDPGGKKFLSAYGLIPWNLTTDGKVWVGQPETSSIQKLDIQTGQWGEPDYPYHDVPPNTPETGRPHFYYDMYANSQKNVYLTDNGSEYIEEVDAKTSKTSYYQTPTFNSAPRRGHVDKQDRLWFGEFQGNKIGMFDPKTKKVTEWELPTPFSGPYDVVLDKNGFAWAAGMTTDRVARLNPQTGEIIEYLLPRKTNMRRVEVDNTTDPIAFWSGDNHGASIVKLEPLE